MGGWLPPCGRRRGRRPITPPVWCVAASAAATAAAAAPVRPSPWRWWFSPGVLSSWGEGHLVIFIFFFLHARASMPLPFHPSTAFRGEGAGHHPRLPAYSVTAANDARQGGPSEGAAQYRQERAPLGEMWMGWGVGRRHRPLRAARHGSVPLGVEYSPTWTPTPVCSAGGDRVGGDDNEGEPVLVGRPVTWRTWRQGKLAAPPLPKEL